MTIKIDYVDRAGRRCAGVWEEHLGEWFWTSMADFECGAAVAFGLMGMAEAIRQRCTCPHWVDEWEEVCERCKGYP